jgi:uncharacterized protein (TIGR03435 family)
MRRWLLLLLLVAAPALLHGQQPDQKPLAFEVASVKPSNPAENAIGQTWTRTQYRAKNAPLFFLISQSFGRSQDDEIAGAPAWLKTDRWDIVAEAPTPGPPFPRLRALLEDRFKLVTHVETRTLPVYELVVVRRDGTLGPQLRAATGRGQFRQGTGLFTARATSVGILANTLAYAAHGRVIDHTGLNDKYDIDLRWVVDTPKDGNAQPASDDAPSIFTAVQEQLGLKLQPTKAAVEVLVIDHVEKPTPD